MGKNQTLAEIAKPIKGESSFWINREKLTVGKFAWQDDYFAVSVGESQLERVQKYIHAQEIHHQKNSFSAGNNELLLKYGWKQPWMINFLIAGFLSLDRMVYLTGLKILPAPFRTYDPEHNGIPSIRN